MSRSLTVSSRRLRKDRGVSSVEYIIILVLVAITGIALFKKLGGTVKTKMDNSNQKIEGEVAPL